MLKAQDKIWKGGFEMAITLKAARVNAGLSQDSTVEELNARGVKITKNTLQNYEAYRTTPDIKTAQAMAAVYGLSVDDIIFFVQ